VVLDFQEIIGPHTGENIADLIFDCFKRMGMLNQVCSHYFPLKFQTNIFVQIGCMTADGASNNDKAAKVLERRLQKENIYWDASEHRIHCAPHVIHLAVQNLLSILDSPVLPPQNSTNTPLFNSPSPTSRYSSYQDSVTGAGPDDNLADSPSINESDIPVGVAGSISRVSY
jgi:hypothetical protein